MKNTKDKIEIDTDRLDRAALAILGLTLHDGNRAWKGLDWTISNRLYEKGLLDRDPRNQNKSILLSEEGLVKARVAMAEFFSTDTDQT